MWRSCLARNPEKRITEQLFFGWGLVWVLFFSLIVVTNAYEYCGDVGYMLIGLFVAVPYFVLPIFFVPTQYRSPSLAPAKPTAAPNSTSTTTATATSLNATTTHVAAISPSSPSLSETWKAASWNTSAPYWVKANIWIGIFGFVGNYLWTHYFYHVLGASYSFPVKIQLNGVPFFLYLITHAYFSFYHSLTNWVIRGVRQSRFYTTRVTSDFHKLLVNSLLVFLLAVVTAFMETWTIASVPYYSHQDKFAMYTVGSVFYGIYFFASFPMFFRLDESSALHSSWTVWDTVVDALAATMLVTLGLDFSRLLLCNFAPHLVASSHACSNLPFLLF